MRVLIAATMLLALLAGPSAAEILLQHDFDDGTDGPFTPLGPGWAVVDGAYHCFVEGYANFSTSLAGDPYWGDTTVSWDVKVEGSVNHVMHLRATDFYDFYFVNFRGAPYDDVMLVRQSYEDYRIVCTAPCAFADVGVWHHVEVQILGYEFTVLVDDHLVLVCEDPDPLPELRNGMIGVVCYSGGSIQWQEAWFDNVLVTDTAIATDAVTWGGVKALYR